MANTAITPQEMAQRVSKGFLSFPVPHFDERYDYIEQPYRQRIA